MKKKHPTKKRAEKAAVLVEEGVRDELLLDVPYDERLSKRDRKKVAKRPSYSYLVTMLYSNGKKKTFVVVSKKESFRHGGRNYFLRYQDQYVDVTTGMAELIFHDDHAVPVGHDMAVDEEGDPYHVIRSSNVKEFVDQEFVRVMASAQQLNKLLQFSLILQTFQFFAVMALLYMVWNLSTAGTA